MAEGYVTEKVIESWDNGCIPIYCGLDSQKYLNTEAILDLSALELGETISRIISFLNDINAVNEVSNKPILIRTFNTNVFIDKVLDLINAKYS